MVTDAERTVVAQYPPARTKLLIPELPAAHGAVKDAADGGGLADTAGAVESDRVLAAAGHGGDR